MGKNEKGHEMKIELEIITDRLPTEADGPRVLAHDNALRCPMWYPVYWHEVHAGEVWAKMPPPPEPQIDTSLAASIERIEEKRKTLGVTSNDRLMLNDLDAILESSRKWDAHCRKHRGPSFTHPEAMASKSEYVRKAKEVLASLATDPDGAGEGWRQIGGDETLQKGDEAWTGTCNGEKCWTPIAGMFGSQAGQQIYRRRIEAEQ